MSDKRKTSESLRELCMHARLGQLDSNGIARCLQDHAEEVARLEQLSEERRIALTLFQDHVAGLLVVATAMPHHLTKP